MNENVYGADNQNNANSIESNEYGISRRQVVKVKKPTMKNALEKAL